MQRIRVLRWICFLLLLGAQNIAWADIPPPPPDFPGTDLTLPNPVSTAIGGLLLSAAILVGGMQLIRGKSQSSRKTVWAFGGLFLATTIALTIWSALSYQSYDRARSNWRSSGPVEQYDLENSVNSAEDTNVNENDVP